jgi:AAA+ ATPase superfamily predicted ATPase
MEIILKRNWDIPVSPPDNNLNNYDEEGFFIGREMEIELLKNEIKRKDQGSILISGHRGVGKTTLVYKVLQDLYAEQRLQQNRQSNEQAGENISAKKMFVILINAGQFELTTADNIKKITPETILKTLIRRLYSTGKSFVSEDHKSDLELLYKKAIAKEYKSEENIHQQLEQIISDEKKRELNVQLKEFDKGKIIHIISFLLGTVLLTTKALGETISKIAAMALAFPLPFLINYSISYNRSKQTKTSNSNSADLLYQMDNDVSNLEYDLEELHKKLNLAGYKIVYVIDELDKLGDINKVAQVIKYFKNLFTLSKAIFIFIGNEDIYESSTIEGEGKLFRPEQYTYFSSKFFISRPTWQDLVNFLDNSMLTKPANPKEIDLIRLQHFLALEAGNDFYNLINVIKSNIQSYTKDGNPVLVININNPENIKKSRFHKCQVVVFNKKYYIPTIAKRYENELLLRQLMKYGLEITLAFPKSNFADPNDPDNISSIKRDFNNLLLKLEVFSISSETIQNINGVNVPIRQFSYTGYFKDDPPDRLNVLSEYETRFVSLSAEYLQLILPVVNEFRNEKPLTLEDLKTTIIEENKNIDQIVPVDLLIPFPNWQSSFTALSQDPPVIIKLRDEVENDEMKLKEDLSRISNSYFRLAIEIIKRKVLDKVGFVETLANDKARKELYGSTMLYNMDHDGKLAIFYDLKKSLDFIIVSYTYSIDYTLIEDLIRKNYLVWVICTAEKKEEIIGNEIFKQDENYFIVNDIHSLINATRKIAWYIEHIADVKHSSYPVDISA